MTKLDPCLGTFWALLSSGAWHVQVPLPEILPPWAWCNLLLSQLRCPPLQEALPDPQVRLSILSGLPIPALLTLCHPLLGMGGLPHCTLSPQRKGPGMYRSPVKPITGSNTEFRRDAGPLKEMPLFGEEPTAGVAVASNRGGGHRLGSGTPEFEFLAQVGGLGHNTPCVPSCFQIGEFRV